MNVTDKRNVALAIGCPVCTEKFSRTFTPMIISPCGDPICKLCLDTLQSKDPSPPCPICRTIVKEAAVNKTVLDRLSNPLLATYLSNLKLDDEPASEAAAQAATA